MGRGSEGGFHKYALADARPVGCDIKPPADIFTQPNRYFATRQILRLREGLTSTLSDCASSSASCCITVRL